MFQIAAGVTATGGMTITGGAADDGAGVNNQGNLTITGSIIQLEFRCRRWRHFRSGIVDHRRQQHCYGHDVYTWSH